MNPKSPEAMDERPFEGMAIDDTSVLDHLDGRSPCPKCYKSRKYFCYTCYVPISELEGKIPNIKLPLKIDIIKHEKEIDGKSTAIHGPILASEDVTIYTYPDIPDYSKEDKVFLVYPSKTSVEIPFLFNNNSEINSLVQQFASENLTDGHCQGTLLTHRFPGKMAPKKCLKLLKSSELPIKKAVFIDSTWNQSRGIYKDDRMKKLPCVVIQNRVSQFWRHQKGSPRWYLATIEAVHQFLLEVHLNAWGVSPLYKGPHCEDYRLDDACDLDSKMYNGQYDNILFFFSHMYTKIHKLYGHDDLKAYKRPMDLDI